MMKELVFSKRQTMSLVLLLSIFIQIFSVIMPVSVYADSKASVEIILTDENSNPISDGKIRVSKQGVKDLKFTKENGIYKIDPSGSYGEITTGSYGDVIIADIELGSYNLSYIKNGEPHRVTSFEITNKSEFKQVNFKLGKDENSGPTDVEPEDIETSKDLVLTFNSKGVDYRIENESGQVVSFVKTNKGYASGGQLKTIKSDNRVNISSLGFGKYSIIGQGKRYRINYNENRTEFNIVDEEAPVIETIIDTGSMNVSIKDRKTSKPFRGAEFEILDASGNRVGFRRTSATDFRYEEGGTIDSFLFNKKEISLKGLPVGYYNIVDLDEDNSKFEETEVEIIKDKTAVVTIRKGVVENDLFLRVYTEDEDDDREYLSDFVFNIESIDEELLRFTFDEETESYIYDEDGEEDIVSVKNGIDIQSIPHNDISLILVKAPEGFRDDLDSVDIDLQKNKKYNFKAELLEYKLNITNEEDEPVEDVIVSILGSDKKEVSKGISNKDGVVSFNGLEEDDYTIKVIGVPSPYSLPNQGLEMKAKVEDDTIIIIDDINNNPIRESAEIDDETMDEDVSNNEEVDQDTNSEEVEYIDDEEETSDEVIVGIDSIVVPYASFIATTSTGQAGSIFSFVDKDGEEVYRLISEDDGSISIDKIDHGEYVVTQLTVADGYRIDQEKFKLIVDETYVSKEHVFENSKIGGEVVEETKDNNTSTLFIILVAIVIFLAVISLYLSNLKYKEEHGENKYKIFDKLDDFLGDKEEFDLMSDEEIKALEENNDNKDIIENNDKE